MPSLGKTTAKLSRFRTQWAGLMQQGAGAATQAARNATHLDELTDFGSNPGNLRMLAHVPARLAPSPALVVVLHGCTQTAAAYDHGAGWSQLADRHGFAVLLPEQRKANNQNACFNWFQLGDTGRDGGEALSIRQGVARMVERHGIDPARVFVTGLSAGGAMTSCMLAAYPEVFAGGAVVAGLPHGAAGNVQEAFEAMFQVRAREARQWGDLVRSASAHRGPWPTVSIWHGGADATVRPQNAQESVKQWTNVHGLSPTPALTEIVDGQERRVWRDAAGRDVVESYAIAGMGHGTPITTRGADACGATGPYILEAGISSSPRIAAFWGLTGTVIEAAEAKPIEANPAASEAKPSPEPRARGFVLVDRDEAAPEARPTAHGRPAAEPKPDRRAPAAFDPAAVINKALRAAGLLKH